MLTVAVSSSIRSVEDSDIETPVFGMGSVGRLRRSI
jgi:hypothetical protein